MQLCLFFLLVPCCAHGAKILLLIANLNSHVLVFSELGKALAKHGNEVSAVIGEHLDPPVDSHNYITWTKHPMKEPSIMNRDADLKQIFHGYQETSLVEKVASALKHFRMSTMETMQVCTDKDLLESLSQQTYDFAIVDSPYFPLLFVPYILDPPFAALSVDHEAIISRIPSFSSYVPTLPMAYTDRMNLNASRILLSSIQDQSFLPC